tara:strand:+ start:279 stop:566 length:288 start_codon:yes stop_codon:yes gene_type:complete
MNLEKLREEIDKLDKEILSLIAQRQKCVEKVALVKNNKDLVVDKKRIEEVIRRVKRLAKEKGLSEKIAESLWRKLIELSIDHEYEILKNQEKKEV